MDNFIPMLSDFVYIISMKIFIKDEKRD